MKSNLLAVAIASSLLVGCATSTKSKLITRQEVTLEELQQLCIRTDTPVGCAFVGTTECIIYMPKPSEYEKIRAMNSVFRGLKDNLLIEFFILGHETKHCFDGQFHEENSSVKR